MEVIDTITKMSEFVDKARKEGRKTGFIPTMGALHEGHLSLIHEAKKENDLIVISVFVNPTQFGPGEDFEGYPRDLKRDRDLASGAGCDIIFTPGVKEMYPEGYSTYVDVEGLTENLCGASRPGHFRGVMTVVAKLFWIVRPDIAYFGQKDLQQAIVVKRMVRDLNMPVKIKTMPTIRHTDGLAMSSRNAYLSGEERTRALVLYQALKKAGEMAAQGEKDPKKLIKTMKSLVEAVPGAKIEYASIVDMDSLKDAKEISGNVMAALAVKIGRTRLIDNVILKGSVS